MIGKNLTACNKSLICGPLIMLPFFIGSLVLFISIVTSWVIFVGYFLRYYGLVAIVYITLAVFLFQLYNFIRAFLGDPGIIPRGHPSFQPLQQLDDKGTCVDVDVSGNNSTDIDDVKFKTHFKNISKSSINNEGEGIKRIFSNLFIL
jgi:hypothetical protein